MRREQGKAFSRLILLDGVVRWWRRAKKQSDDRTAQMIYLNCCRMGELIESSGSPFGIVRFIRMARKKIVAGNWKMNGSALANAELLSSIKAAKQSLGEVEVVVFPPFPYLAQVQSMCTGSDFT